MRSKPNHIDAQNNASPGPKAKTVKMIIGGSTAVGAALSTPFFLGEDPTLSTPPVASATLETERSIKPLDAKDFQKKESVLLTSSEIEERNIAKKAQAEAERARLAEKKAAAHRENLKNPEKLLERSTSSFKSFQSNLEFMDKDLGSEKTLEVLKLELELCSNITANRHLVSELKHYWKFPKDREAKNLLIIEYNFRLLENDCQRHGYSEYFLAYLNKQIETREATLAERDDNSTETVNAAVLEEEVETQSKDTSNKEAAKHATSAQGQTPPGSATNENPTKALSSLSSVIALLEDTYTTGNSEKIYGVPMTIYKSNNYYRVETNFVIRNPRHNKPSPEKLVKNADEALASLLEFRHDEEYSETCEQLYKDVSLLRERIEGHSTLENAQEYLVDLQARLQLLISDIEYSSKSD